MGTNCTTVLSDGRSIQYVENLLSNANWKISVPLSINGLPSPREHIAGRLIKSGRRCAWYTPYSDRLYCSCGLIHPFTSPGAWAIEIVEDYIQRCVPRKKRVLVPETYDEKE